MGEVGAGLTLDARVATREALPHQPTDPFAPSDADGPDGRGDERQRPREQERERWKFWRSPPDQPVWARPCLLIVAALAVFSYGWAMNGDMLETFYGGAVRSMALNWHNFFFGAFDPWGTVSVDKLPGAFWVQALSIRLFGFHVWAMVLPQAVEGALTVLVLFRVVRRIAGPAGGLAASIALAVTPVTILLNRGNISDSLLILLLVLAADAATKAFTEGRLAPLVMSSVWVGLAFQTKMLQAWLVLPALYLAYILAAPALSLARRCGHAALAGVVVVVVSLSWMSVVSLVPAHDRPYVDGSCNNSVFSQVFLYNGADRLTGKVLDQPGCTPTPASVPSTTSGGAQTVSLGKGPARFLGGMLGRDAAWLFVPAVIALGGILIARRRRPRTDPWRAAALLWGTWMVLTWGFFASSQSLNPYYLAALAPPMAALCGLGVALAWQMRHENRAVPAICFATVGATVAYGLFLTPRSAGVWPWVLVTSVLLAGATLVWTARWLLSISPLRSRPHDGDTSSRLARAALVLGSAAVLAGAAWASGTAVNDRLGPFDSPYQPAAQTASEQAGWARAVAVWPAASADAARAPAAASIVTAETSPQVSMLELATGREFLPVGGFSGQVPATPLRQFIADVGRRQVSHVAVSVKPMTRNPDMLWVVAHCRPARVTAEYNTFRVDGRTYRAYVCAPANADR